MTCGERVIVKEALSHLRVQPAGSVSSLFHVRGPVELAPAAAP